MIKNVGLPDRKNRKPVMVLLHRDVTVPLRKRLKLINGNMSLWVEDAIRRELKRQMK